MVHAAAADRRVRQGAGTDRTAGGLVVAARQVLAYPAGVEAEVEARARRSPAGGAPPGPVDLTAHP
jgi:hypothetical protein